MMNTDKTMNTTASTDTTPNLTWEKLAETWEIICPPLYYATDIIIKRGQMFLVKDPEFIVCHPDDLDELRRRITHRRLVHLRDRPSADFTPRIELSHREDIISAPSSLRPPRLLQL